MPICFALDAETLYTAVDAKPKRSRRLRRLASIAANPTVSVLVDRYESDWSKLWWVVAEGQASVRDARPYDDRALELLAAKYPQYAAQRPDGPVIVIRIARWRSWSATPGSWSG